ICILMTFHSSAFFPLFFFTATAPTEIYTLSLHDALPIYDLVARLAHLCKDCRLVHRRQLPAADGPASADKHGVNGERRRPERHRSEEHTSELQSRFDLVCRLLLEKKKQNTTHARYNRTLR